MERIYVLGAGSIGCLLAAVLSMTSTPVTLIFRDELQVKRFEQAKNEIVLNRTYSPNTPKVSTKVQAISLNSLGDEIIDTLIVSTKVHQTVPALKP